MLIRSCSFTPRMNAVHRALDAINLPNGFVHPARFGLSALTMRFEHESHTECGEGSARMTENKSSAAWMPITSHIRLVRVFESLAKRSIRQFQSAH